MERIRVFISSTQIDMQPERDAVEAVVKRLGHECLRAETYIAPAKSPIKVCREMACKCDVYIGIYGRRYGSLDPQLKLSVTEIEYDEARNDDPNKILIYIKQEPEYESRQQNFLARIQDFQHGYFRHNFFSNTDELTQQVESDLIAWVSERVHKLKKVELDMRSLRIKLEFIQNYYKQIGELQGLPKEILL